MKLSYALYLFLIFNTFCYSQNANSPHTSKIVFLKDPNLKNILKKIIKKDISCQIKGLDWYLDFMKNDIILISKYNIENLVAARGISKIYTTTIDDKILFIVGTEGVNDAFTKSEHSIDLSYYIGKENYLSTDYSFWVFQKKGRKYQFIKEKQYNCN